MAADVVQAKYDDLERIATRFAQQADAQERLLREVEQRFDRLRCGSWQGKGIDAFSREMDLEVLPAMRRLTEASQKADVTIRSMVEIIHTAEDEAAQLFLGSNPKFRAQGGNGGSFTGDINGNRFASANNQRVVPVNGISRQQDERSIWDYVRAKGDIVSFGVQKSDSKPRGKFDPEIELKIGTDERSVWGKPGEDGLRGVGGFVEGGVEVGTKGVMIGAGGEVYAVKGEWDGALVGNKEYGVTGGVEVKGLSAEGFGGLRFDGKGQQIGASIGGTLVSVEGSLGGNVAGTNLSLTGEAGIKAELGLVIGKKTEIKLPFFSFGLRFGDGVD